MKEVFSDRSEYRWRLPALGRQAVAAVVAVSFLVTGCAARPAGSYFADTAPQAVSSTTDDQSLEIFDSPEGACGIRSVRGNDGGDVKEAAEQCLSVYGNTKIALLNYALTKDDAKKLASTTQAYLSGSTKEVINPRIAIIEPSDLATQAFNEQVPGECIDPVDMKKSGAYIAAATMPELNEYDKIVGIMNRPACETTTNMTTSMTPGGVAFVQHNRYADIYIGQPLGRLGIFTAHELAHLFGLGHAGSLSGATSHGGFTDINGIYDKDKGPIDLGRYISSGLLQEYGQKSIMGSPVALSPGSTLDTAQLYALEWPQRELGVGTSIELHDLDNSPIALNMQKKEGDWVIRWRLDSPLQMPSSENGEMSLVAQEEFRSVIFSVHYFQNEAYWVDVMLLGDYNSTIQLGSLSGDAELSHGGKIVKVVFDEDAGKIRFSVVSMASPKE